MAIRMSAHELNRLKKRLPAGAKVSSARVGSKAAAQPGMDDSSKAGIKKGRMSVGAYLFDPVVIEAPLPPQTKQRARTFVDLGVLMRAFHSAKGSPERFKGMINDTLVKSLVKAFSAASGDPRRYAAMIRDVFQSKSLTPEATREFERAVGLMGQLAMRGREPFDHPITMEFEFRIEGDPGDWPVAQQDGDLDNHIKSCVDSLNGIVYVDDRLVVQKNSIKICSKTPGITIRILPPPEAYMGLTSSPAQQA